jgi:LacI family transcriptional regulator
MGVTVVRLGEFPHPQDHEMPAVLPDIAAAGRLAADHFAEREFRHVAYIGHQPWKGAKTRYDGFRERAVERGCECHLLRLKEPKGPLSSARITARDKRWRHEIVSWLKNLPKPVGLFLYNDTMAANICSWCLRAGIAVPEEVAIIGDGNDRYACRIAPVTLSSVDRNYAEYGRQAVRLLRRLVDGEPPPAGPIMIQPKRVIVRQSTNVLAVPDSVVALALRYMWDHFDLPLSVDDIAVEAGVCRRTLERRFRKHLNRSVNGVLQQKRLERCCQLLRTTDLTIPQIADAVGFRSKDHLHHIFRKTYHITLRQYRTGNGKR